MQSFGVSGAVRLIYKSLGIKGIRAKRKSDTSSMSQMKA